MTKKSKNGESRPTKNDIEMAKQFKAMERDKLFSNGFSLTVYAGTISFLGFWFFQGIISFSGEETNAVIQLTADLKIDKYIFNIVTSVFGAIGVSFGVVCKRFYKKKNDHLANRNKILEETLDPKRSSSGLLKSGHQPDGE